MNLKELTLTKKAVIFDLDGTLVDSMWMWLAIDIEYLSRFGYEVPHGLQKEIEGMSYTETAVYFKERFNIPDDLDTIKADWTQMAWGKYTNEIPLKDGVREYLKFCKDNGIKLAIASSNVRDLVEQVLKVHGILEMFDAVIVACDVKKGKPAPDVYLCAADKLGENPKDCLVFEDIIPGIMAGKAAGMEVVAVEDRYSQYQREDKEKLSDYYINDYR